MKRTLLILLILSPVAKAASEIRAFCPGVTNAYAVVRQADGDVWYITGQTFEAWGTGGRTAADYDIALTDKGGDMFVGTFDANIGTGTYYVAVHNRVGGAPADTDPVLWYDYGDWDGSAYNIGGPNDLAVAVREEIDANSVMLAGIKAMTDLMSVNTTTVSAVDANDPNEEFTLTAGVDVNDAYAYHAIMVEDATDSHIEVRRIYTYSVGRIVVLDDPLAFTPAANDRVWILGPAYGGWLVDIINRIRSSQIPVYRVDDRR